MLEEQYEALAGFVDEIAERIRMMGGRAPGSMREFIGLATLTESEEPMSSEAMLQTLLNDHQRMCDILRKHIKECQAQGDEGTADLLIQQLRHHEQVCWMIRSQI